MSVIVNTYKGIGMSTGTEREFHSFNEFYPFYLGEHQNRISRRLHFVGTSLVLALLVFTTVTQQWVYLLAFPVIGYGFAWVGHFFFEHNKPATFKWPFYSLMGDFVMFRDILIRRIEW